MQTFLNVVTGLLGLGSIIFGAIGFNAMVPLWRVLHVIAGIVLVWRALPVATATRTTRAVADEPTRRVR